LLDYHSYHENVARIEAYLDVYTRGLEGPITGGDPDPERLLTEMITSGGQTDSAHLRCLQCLPAVPACSGVHCS
jgi:hypothetical protein